MQVGVQVAAKPVYVPQVKATKDVETPLKPLDVTVSQKQGENKPVHRFQPGQSGNPGGRPKGAKTRLEADFMWALADTFREKGKDAVEAVIRDKPHEYLKIIAQLMPKEVNVTTTMLDEMSLEQLEESLATLKRLQASGDVEDVTPKP